MPQDVEAVRIVIQPFVYHAAVIERPSPLPHDTEQEVEISALIQECRFDDTSPLKPAVVRTHLRSAAGSYAVIKRDPMMPKPKQVAKANDSVLCRVIVCFVDFILPWKQVAWHLLEEGFVADFEGAFNQTFDPR